MNHVDFTGECVPGGHLDVFMDALPPVGSFVNFQGHRWQVSGLPTFDVVREGAPIISVPVEPRAENTGSPV